MSLKAIAFDEAEVTLSILDQLLIPYQTKYVPVKSIDDGYTVIKKMQVRGAPAIAIVGCFSVAVELNSVVNQTLSLGYDISDMEAFKSRLSERIDFLIESRPTAVNLLNACNELKQIISSCSDVKSMLDQVIRYSVKLHAEDLVNNYKIGENGVAYLGESHKKEAFKGGFSVMTICNTGSLATSGHGTALGIIRSLWDVSKANPQNAHNSEIQTQTNWLSHVYCCETRPYNQGSRLTSYELAYERIPFTLITDNMVSFLIDSIRKKSSVVPCLDPVKAIIVGADRVVSNGDLANKIGTFQLSLIATHYPEIKFIGALPTTTIDLTRQSGDQIVIEQRPPEELTNVLGGEVDSKNEFARNSDGNVKLTRVKVATPNISVWNPSFDVTPHENIDCVVTERGFFAKKDGKFSFA